MNTTNGGVISVERSYMAAASIAYLFCNRKRGIPETASWLGPVESLAPR